MRLFAALESNVTKVAFFIPGSNGAIGKDDTRRRDIVVMDDFLYGEPQAIQ